MRHLRPLLIFALFWLATSPASANRTRTAVDQNTTRTLSLRGFGIFGTVNPAASFYFAVDGVEQLPRPTREEDGTFFGAWPVDENVFHEAAAQINGLMRGTLARPGQSDAVAEKPIHLLVPPKSEVLLYDHAGNLRSDAFWSYSWDSFGHLTALEHHSPPREPDISADEISYSYDADGRRIRSSHVVTRINGSVETVENEVSVILWAGWLPIMEERQWIKNDGVQKQNRRWFQWGPDRSETLDAAGGIGGLVAIHEETMDGQWKRTLLPLQDGLGNVTAVLDASTNAPVAQYAYGPYGEYIGETGETDACPFRWQTKWFTPATGQYNFGFRCYDPRLGRWLSRDPLREDGGYNLYAYCGNDPVNGYDSLGLDFLQEWPKSARLLHREERAGRISEFKELYLRMQKIGIRLESNALLYKWYEWGKDEDLLQLQFGVRKTEWQFGISTIHHWLDSGAKFVIKLGVDASPAGAIVGLKSFFTGKDIFGKKLSWGERIIEGIPFAAKVAGPAKKLFGKLVGDWKARGNPSLSVGGSTGSISASGTLAAQATGTKIWLMEDTARGVAIENQLAKTEYRDWFRVGELRNKKFPLVDFQNGKNLVSLKTIDTNGSTWLRRMQKHIEDLAKPGIATVDGKRATMILDIRVQPGGLRAAQQLVEYGSNLGITVLIKEFP